MNINNLLESYKDECPYYDRIRYLEAQNGDIISLINVGTDFARAEMFRYAVECWEYIINLGKGNSDVYSNLGVCYYYGNGVKQDYKKAVSYYRRAAAQDHPFGMYNLAVACENGNGTPKDVREAIQYYHSAAKKGVNMAVEALIRLGLYSELQGPSFYPRNWDDDSFSPINNYNSCFDSANHKSAMALSEYGTILGEVFKDEAVDLYLKAASFKETSVVYYKLATLYKDFKEYDKAIIFYEKSILKGPTKAAKQGLLYAQQKLKGKSVEKKECLSMLKNNGINYFYHFTDRANLLSIRHNGGLFSWKYLEEHNIDIPNAGGNDLSRNLDKKFGLEDYVRLSFCKDLPMLYHKKQDGGDMILLEISTDVVLLDDVLFSNMNATDSEHECGRGIEYLNKIDFHAVRDTYVPRDSSNFKKHQAEVLVKTSVPSEYILNLDSLLDNVDINDLLFPF